MDENAEQSSTPPRAKKARPLTFAFEARSKPLVEQVMALDAKKFKRLFRRKPKLSIQRLATALNDNTSAEKLAKMLPGFHGYYYTHSHAEKYYESLGRLLLEGAANEKNDGDRQQFLLFQSIEALSIAVQKSPKTLNISAQSVIVAIYKILGSQHYETAATEREVHRQMMNMLNIKKDPNDLTSREIIIKLYLRGRRYYEALVQLAEYERIMRATSRPLYHQKKGEIEFRKAAIFQSMIDFYYNLKSGKKDEQKQVVDMNKLNGFIARFNRDNRRFNLTPLTAPSILAVQKTVSSMIGVANHFYMNAAKSEKFVPKHKAYYFISHNHHLMENSKAAILSLRDGARVLDQVKMHPTQRMAEKIKFLEFIYRLHSERGEEKSADATTKEIANIRAKAKIEAKTGKQTAAG